VNNLFATNRRTGGRFKSKRYKAWINAAGWALRSQSDRGNRHTGPVKLTLIFRKPNDNRRRDISNLVKALEDLVVLHQILADDSLVKHLETSWATCGFEGAKVIIEDATPE
jgi:crossover junction endodeoxyribonuclease RusA